MDSETEISFSKKTHDDSQLNHVLTRGKLVFHTWPDRFGYVNPLNIVNLNLKTDFFLFLFDHVIVTNMQK